MTEPPGGTTRFAVNLAAADDARFTRLVNALAESVGRVPSHRGMRHPSRADLLRAMLTVTENNSLVRAAVEREVRADVARRNPSDEITAVASALHRLAPSLTGSDAQEELADHASRLDGVASSLYDDRATSAERLHQTALRVERLGATAGGYDYLRPLLDLAERLEVIRDALEPTAVRTQCPRCRLLVRRAALPGGIEAHNDQSGVPCRERS